MVITVLPVPLVVAAGTLMLGPVDDGRVNKLAELSV